jgi:hypothetical protein
MQPGVFTHVSEEYTEKMLFLVGKHYHISRCQKIGLNIDTLLSLSITFHTEAP